MDGLVDEMCLKKKFGMFHSKKRRSSTKIGADKWNQKRIGQRDKKTQKIPNDSFRKEGKIKKVTTKIRILESKRFRSCKKLLYDDFCLMEIRLKSMRETKKNNRNNYKFD